MVPKLLQRRYVAYYRVSTDKQGRSGLGLDAQKAQVAGFIERTSGRVLRAFTEVQSGKDNDRPQLQAALAYCSITNATLLIAKLDRLSRNASFLLALQDSGARFVAADMPEANETMVGFMAVLAQAERTAISARTKAALQAAKARGKKLGNPNLQPGTREGAAIANQRKTEKATKQAEKLRGIVSEAFKDGAESLQDVADYLTEREVKTPRGSEWTRIGVSRLLTRLGIDRDTV